MKIKTICIAFFVLLGLAIRVPAVFGQHPVLFETFTNTCSPCPDGLRPTFDAAVKSVLSSEGSKIIYLNYHVGNFCDPMAQPASGYTGSVDERLSGGTSVTIYDGAVDRTDFGGGHASGTGTDWSGEIDQESGKTPPASLTLTNATLDKTASGTAYTLRANVTVTANQSIPDNINIFFAVVQDDLNLPSNTNGICKTDPGSEPLGPYNSVVWYITGGTGIPVFTGGVSSGATKQISFSQSLANAKADPLFVWSKMRLIAFIEESSNATDYHVVNAGDLKDDLDTLQPPPPTLSLTSSGLDNDTIVPGSNAQIFYSSTNLSRGVDAYYSLNNGATWNLILDSQFSPINWTVPDSLTTQGKIKLVAVGDPSLVSIETGNFTIALALSISFVRPAPGEVLGADTNYMIEWTKYGVDSVNLQYALADNHGGFSTWIPISTNPITDSFFIWKIPDINSIAELQLIPVRKEAPAMTVTVTIEKFVNSVASSNTADGLTIAGVFPNPAASGEEVVLRYSEGQPKPITVQVLDLLGRSAAQGFHLDDQAIYVDTRALAAGAYIVRVTDGVNVVSKRVEILR